MTAPQKWYPLTPSQEWKKICEAEDKVILQAYVKAGDPAAIQYKKEQQANDQTN